MHPATQFQQLMIIWNDIATVKMLKVSIGADFKAENQFFFTKIMSHNSG